LGLGLRILCGEGRGNMRRYKTRRNIVDRRTVMDGYCKMCSALRRVLLWRVRGVGFGVGVFAGSPPSRSVVGGDGISWASPAILLRHQVPSGSNGRPPLPNSVTDSTKMEPPEHLRMTLVVVPFSKAECSLKA